MRITVLATATVEAAAAGDKLPPLPPPALLTPLHQTKPLPQTQEVVTEIGQKTEATANFRNLFPRSHPFHSLARS